MAAESLPSLRRTARGTVGRSSAVKVAVGGSTDAPTGRVRMTGVRMGRRAEECGGEVGAAAATADEEVSTLRPTAIKSTAEGESFGIGVGIAAAECVVLA